MTFYDILWCLYDIPLFLSSFNFAFFVFFDFMLPHAQEFVSSSQYANVICQYILQTGSPEITNAQVNQHEN